MERDVYVRPPREANCPIAIIWKLNKAAYGLSDAAKLWFNSFSSYLKEIDIHQSREEKSLFLTKGAILVHLDDILFGGTTVFHEQFIDKIKEKI